MCSSDLVLNDKKEPAPPLSSPPLSVHPRSISPAPALTREPPGGRSHCPVASARLGRPWRSAGPRWTSTCSRAAALSPSLLRALHLAQHRPRTQPHLFVLFSVRRIEAGVRSRRSGPAGTSTPAADDFPPPRDLQRRPRPSPSRRRQPTSSPPPQTAPR